MLQMYYFYVKPKLLMPNLILNLFHLDTRDLGRTETVMVVVVVVVVGGGKVMVMVKDCYQATEIPMEDVSGEVCWVKIETDDNPLYVGSFYRIPSDKSTYQLAELEKSLHNINLISHDNPNATVVVAGDFNLGDVDWDSCIVPPGARHRSNSEKILDILYSNNLE